MYQIYIALCFWRCHSYRPGKLIITNFLSESLEKYLICFKHISSLRGNLIVVLLFQISSTSTGEGEYARPVEDAYENYQQINENYHAYENPPKPNPSVIQNKQGAADFMGPNTDVSENFVVSDFSIIFSKLIL